MTAGHVETFQNAFAGPSTPAEASRPRQKSSWESVKRRRIVDQDLFADGLLRSPLRELVEQQGIVWLVGLVGMRPIRAPNHALGGCFDIGSADLVHVGIAGRAIVAAVIGNR